MAEKRKSSEFKDYEIASRMNKFSAGLVNYFLTAILSFILYLVAAIPICENTPVINQSKIDYNNSYWNLVEIINDTKLQTTYDKRLLTLDEMGGQYLRKLTFSTFKNQGLEETPLSKVKIKDENVLTLKNDTLAYYFLSFKYDKKIADQVDENKKIIEFYNVFNENELFSRYFDIVSFDTLNLENYQIYLKDEYAKEMDLYLISSSNVPTNKQETIYGDLLELYRYVAKRGINEVETKYEAYIVEQGKYDKAYKTYTEIMSFSMIITFTIVFLILNVGLIFAFKNRVSLGDKVFKIVHVSLDGNKPNWWQITVKKIFEFISFFSGLLFIPIFTNSYGLLGTELIGPINLLSLLVFSLIITILSVLLMLIMPKRQYLSDLASLQNSRSTKFVTQKMEDKIDEFSRQ